MCGDLVLDSSAYRTMVCWVDSDFGEWGKFKLIKYLREKGVEYRDANGIEGLRALARSA